jgi:hypothetical protein
MALVHRRGHALRDLGRVRRRCDHEARVEAAVQARRTRAKSIRALALTTRRPASSSTASPRDAARASGASARSTARPACSSSASPASRTSSAREPQVALDHRDQDARAVLARRRDRVGQKEAAHGVARAGKCAVDAVANGRPRRAPLRQDQRCVEATAAQLGARAAHRAPRPRSGERVSSSCRQEARVVRQSDR